MRPGDAPAYNLFAVNPDGGSVRRITSLNIPSLVSGLLPLEQSADGNRLLAEFVGQDTSVGFRVNPATGRVHALGTDFENGFVAADLTADGRTVLVARAPDGRGARLALRNHPRGGPLFAGPQTQPWLCTTAENGLGAPRDAQCNVAPQHRFVYRSTSPAR